MGHFWQRVIGRLFRLSRRELFIMGALFVMFFFVVPELFGRAGGSGYSSSSDDGGGALIGAAVVAIFTLIMTAIPFPFNIIVIALIVGYIALFYYLNARESSGFNHLPPGAAKKKGKLFLFIDKLIKKMPEFKRRRVVKPGELPKVQGAAANDRVSKSRRTVERFLMTNPDFDEREFRMRVAKAFIMIQKAWQAQNLARVRPFISDGVYQRFNTQFMMMQLLGQKNIIEELKVKSVKIDRIESDGLFDILHVAISASLKDRFINSRYGSLNSGGTDEFVEYWSFIRKRGVEGKDIYSSMNCPSCGGELPRKAGERARCPFCGTIVNSGEYDWVLSEITQADDYIFTKGRLPKSKDIYGKLRELLKENDDFSVQLAEDRASNGYLQVLTAITYKKPELMRRFVADRAFAKLKKRIVREKVVYNRLYLNDVSLIEVNRVGRQNSLVFAVTSSYQRVEIKEQELVKVDNMMVSSTEVVVLSRDVGAAIPKGSLYAHSCPSCGGAIADTLDINCAACGIELNSTAHEWIITDIMSKEQYEKFPVESRPDESCKVKSGQADSLYSVRDYALNNVLIMMAADRRFHDSEREYAEQLAKRWGYKVERIGHLFKMARGGRLVFRMPECPKKRKKIFNLIDKAAIADRAIDRREQALLDEVRHKYL